MTDWEKRAWELLVELCRETCTVSDSSMMPCSIAQEAALQLGREMVVEATEDETYAWLDRIQRERREAADARAEEIAKECERRGGNFTATAMPPDWDGGVARGLWLAWKYAAELARSTIQKPNRAPCPACGSSGGAPDDKVVVRKTREQVLEEALEEIRCLSALGEAAGIARRALEWKP